MKWSSEGWLAAFSVVLLCWFTQERLAWGAPETSFSTTAWRPPVRYELTARLDPILHRIEGSGTIEFLNHSNASLDAIYLHLYLNAFKNTESLFGRSPFVKARGGRSASTWGYIDVMQLQINGQERWPERVAQDPTDETDVKILLPEALAPGQTLVVKLEWVSQLPEIVARTGFSRDYHFAGQWFPKLAKLETNGSWSHFSFHPQAEFYADFADYDVTLDVPTHYVVGATGALVPSAQAESEKDSAADTAARQQLHYRAERVHDFAWVAWPRFLVHEESIEDVAVRVLYPPGHAWNLQATLEALRFGLSHFGERYGRYPYPMLTVVHPPGYAKESGGMEYPTLITTGGAWYAPLFSRSVELVTLHELGHQWFYGLLASNEARYPFLDEGLTSYAELVASREWLGNASAARLLGFEISVEALHRAGAARYGGEHSLALAASEFPSFATLGSLVYSRTATLLYTLANVHGEAAMRRALQRYAEEQRFQHPTPHDLLRVVEREIGVPAREQLQTALFERGFIDVELSQLLSVPVPSRAGVFGTGAEQHEVPSVRSAGYLTRVTITRRGNLAFPIEVELTRDDGVLVRQHWDGQGTHWVLEHESARPVVAARVDPDQKNPLDQQLFNNSRTTKPEGALRSLDRLLYWAQLLLRYVGP